MNTRLQVEHPVTEMVTGLDIVREQIRVAAGEPLSFRAGGRRLPRPRDRVPHQRRVGASGFVPLPGTITRYEEPGGPGVRVDSGVFAGWTVPPFYDSLLAKLIVWDETREAATARMLRALAEFRIEGIATLVPFHRALLASERMGARRDGSPTCSATRDWLAATAPAD